VANPLPTTFTVNAYEGSTVALLAVVYFYNTVNGLCEPGSEQAPNMEGEGLVTVVAGAHPEAVSAAVEGLPNVRVVVHNGWAAGQLSSLRAGLAAVDGDDVEALLVTLVDSLVQPATVRLLIETWQRTRADRASGHRSPPRASGDLSIASPSTICARRRSTWALSGHRAGCDAIVNVAVDDAGVLADIDTPEDYEAFVRERGR
jgi:molybdenum cofactor cytidylyltransferase